MSTSILDKAIKFGAGRYRQERNLLAECGGEIRRFGEKVYMIAGVTAFEAAANLGRECLDAGCDEVVGIGGGKIMDLAKATAETIGLGVVNIPTSIATCASFATMSVMYTADGALDDTWRYDHEFDAVLVDLDVIAKCPYRYAAAGIVDAMAKKIEIQNGKPVMRPEDNNFDFYTAFRMSEYSYEMLEHYGVWAIEDLRQNRVTPAVEYVTFMNIAMTGVIANTTRNFNQSALAHLIYYGIRSFFTEEAKAALHGEIVAVGLFVQLHYNRLSGQSEQLRAFMKQMDMPLTIGELGVEASAENLLLLENYLKDSPYVDETEESEALLHEAMKELI